MSLEVLHERCCGLDVHKKNVVACLLTPDGKEIRSFGTMTRDLLAMTDWLKENSVTHVAMESTGSYWKPIYNLLEGTEIETLVVNAAHIKTVPGRKTDVKDAEWIADLLRHGLIRSSFIPDRSQRELRELVRYRRQMINERADEVNRIQKVLEGANIKLSSVTSDVLGVSGREMLKGIVSGITDPAALAGMAKGKLRNKEDELKLALHGIIGAHQRKMLALQLEHIEALDRLIEDLDKEIAERLHPNETVLIQLDTITGVGRRTAEEIVSEIGTDMSRFPTDAHLASWAGMCPGNNESAGKRYSGKTRKGNIWLRATLVRSGHAAARSRNTYLSSQYHRIAARRGGKRAAVAVGHRILVIAYHLIAEGTVYQDRGANYYDERKKEAIARRTVKRLEKLGYKVTIEAA